MTYFKSQSSTPLTMTTAVNRESRIYSTKPKTFPRKSRCKLRYRWQHNQLGRISLAKRKTRCDAIARSRSRSGKGNTRNPPPGEERPGLGVDHFGDLIISWVFGHPADPIARDHHLPFVHRSRNHRLGSALTPTRQHSL